MNIDRSGWDAAYASIKTQKDRRDELEKKLTASRDYLREAVTWKGDAHIDSAAAEHSSLLNSVLHAVDAEPKFGPGSKLRNRPSVQYRPWVACGISVERGTRDAYLYHCQLAGSPDTIKGVVTFAEHELELADG